MSDKVVCKFVDKRFYNESNQYTIAIYDAPATSIPTDYRKSGARTVQFSALGTALPMDKKYDILLQGDFRYDEKYGLTMQVHYTETLEPTDLEGIQQYLIDFIDGCGVKTAKAITTYFGTDTIDVLKNHPYKLYDVPRLRKFTVDKIIKSYAVKKDLQEIVTLLSPFGVGPQMITNIQRFYDNRKRNGKANKAVIEIRENPFCLSHFHGISFDTLNMMAIRFDCDLCNRERIASGIKEALRLNEIAGHLCMQQGELRERALFILNNHTVNQPVTRQMVTDVICDMARKLELLGDNGHAYLADTYYHEDKTASMICQLLKGKCKQHDTKKYLPAIEKEIGIELSNNQRYAVDMAVNNKISIITGGAGTGKTTVLNAILKAFYAIGYNEDDIVLVAPTGIAAQRMRDSTKHSASTIHSALGLTAECDDEVSPEDAPKLPCKLVVCDEFSMVDMFVCYKLFSSVDLHKTKVILLGDTGQLPSVGAGNVLHELLCSEVIPNVELNVIFRQAQENLIVRNSANINDGIPKVDFNNDFMFFEQHNAELAAEMITEHYVNSVYVNGIENVQVLSPVKKKGACSVYELNCRIQNVLNPTKPNRLEVKVGMYTFREGDKVIQTQNAEAKSTTDETIALNNGDIGVLKNIYKDEKEYIFRVEFSDKRTVDFKKENMLKVELAYCITIHKSQGSECKHGIIPLLPYFPDALLFRNLLYTGVTRAKQKLEIIGNKNCIYKCIRNNKIVARNTFLAKRIIKYFN